MLFRSVLENLLEQNKPTRPASTVHLDYLLATPFRYHPLRGGSRFRATTDPWVFYGAESVRTASAEVGYHRWKFLHDAVALEKLEPVAHTAFRADLHTHTVDLRKSPFNVDAEAWLHPMNYQATQAFAQAARIAELGGIAYQSVRNPQPGWCLVLLTPQAFARAKPRAAMQTWWLVVHTREVIWRKDNESMAFSAAGWQ